MEPAEIFSEALTPGQIADATLLDRAIVQSGPSIALRYYLDRYWVDDRSVYMLGFMFVPGQQITGLCYLSDGEPVKIPLTPRPDIVGYYGAIADAERAGFSVLMPFRAGAPILLEVTTPLGVTRLSLVLAGRSKVSKTYLTESCYAWFKPIANRAGARILEIGSRVVGSISERRAKDFPLAAHFVGVDIHPGIGVDVVCDAHALGSVFRPASFDFVFSLSVFEHLAAPWLVAAELNSVLSIGGEAMISVPFAWPLHETPNDFWRFSDDGLKLLFGPELGFEVIRSGMDGGVRLVPEWREVLMELPMYPAFNQAWIFARKIAECRASAGAPATQRSRLYPSHGADARKSNE
jgi:hypothetical protein